MNRKPIRKRTRKLKVPPVAPLTVAEAVSPYKFEDWLKLTPAERLRRSWQMRSRIPNLRELHDRKLFPKI
jgi:hypothetical protein